MFWLTSSIGISKLAVLVRLKTSKVNRKRGTLGNLRGLGQRDVRAPLPGLAENIALAMVDEVRLVGIVARNRAIQGPRTQQGQAETTGLSAGSPGVAPDFPVSACLGEQPARGTTGFVMPSFTP